MTNEAQSPNANARGAACRVERGIQALIFVIISSFGFTHSSFAAAALTRAIDIRTLPYERSLEKLPVDLTATIGFVESGGTAFVQDDTAGTHLHFKPARNDLRVGDRVRILGTTTAGLYFPGVDVTSLQILGHAEPPAAAPASYDDLATGRYHYQRVIVEGLGRTLTPLDENRSLLRLAIGSRVLEVRIDSPLETAPALIDAHLRITALAAGGINDRRQLVFPYIRVTDWNDVAITRAAPPLEDLPVTSVVTLLQFGAADEPHHRARVLGTVLASFPDGRVFLRDATPPPPPREQPKDAAPPPQQSPSIAIRLTSPATLSTGQKAEIIGFPIMAGFSASLADAQVITSDEATTAPAVAAAVSLREFLDGSHDANLIHLTAPAVLNDFFRTVDGYELRLTSGGTPLRAFLLQSTVPDLEIGTVVGLTGICLVESSKDRGFRSQAERASLLLRSAEDIAVISTAPFWTTGRLIIAISILAGVVLLAIVWIAALRRQISALSSRIVQQATQDERQRIAREFHDTLEQELAGLSLRLDAATTRPLEDKARTLIETSRSLVSRIQSEARNLVADLRDTEQLHDLPAALREIQNRMPPNAPALQLDLHPLPAIPGAVSHHLRMMAQEAITNTIKHAQATEISLHLSATTDALTLRISDNGRGLASDTATTGQPGHFGCMGIRERARKIGADVSWKSEAGKGTVVTVSLPLHHSSF
ncbi:sensor histidine kinase [Prosthecobacter vanneervenii]|uniref:Signal transduction histidine kinase n=1 Tax=Prosthecobacter vanneervenii TaxID=48466 RepID=A0A7W8DJC4_9BACT|nr:sensor histidine kinase [Prosthecobacter vanneervenii]MBB5031998.1 signal transduction histidine kinase [Prosthecobacter vanneervenii]